MARYTGPKDKKSRAAQTKLFLRGERDFSPKSGFTRRPYPPGMHGSKRKRPKSEFGTQLLEKQKVKWVYGILERQFRRYVEEATRHKGITGEMLVQRLEHRLDNVIYRTGFAPSRNAARQLVSHGHITVNGKKVSIPSFEVRMGDVVGIRTLSRPKKIFGELTLRLKKYAPPSWLSLDKEKLEGTVSGAPTIADAAIPADIQKIIEFYSR
ncbi:MAG: 30S ribosomal protein S4 [bacterium]|nr:30S ribosomal protein S4 [bacterium]